MIDSAVDHPSSSGHSQKVSNASRAQYGHWVVNILGRIITELAIAVITPTDHATVAAHRAGMSVTGANSHRIG
jgi:hypothetical protein